MSTRGFANKLIFCRNVSSDGAEARQRLRECEGLVDALLHALQSAVVNKDTDNKVAEVITPTEIYRLRPGSFSSIEIFCFSPPFSQWRTASASCETCPIMFTKKYQEQSGFRNPMPIIWWGQWGTRRRRMSLTVLEGKNPKVGRPSLLVVLFQFGLLWLKTLMFITDVCNTAIIPFLRLIDWQIKTHVWGRPLYLGVSGDTEDTCNNQHWKLRL